MERLELNPGWEVASQDDHISPVTKAGWGGGRGKLPSEERGSICLERIPWMARTGSIHLPRE